MGPGAGIGRALHHAHGGDLGRGGHARQLRLPGDVLLVGDLDRSAPAWRAFVLRGGTTVMGQVAIRSAYY